MFIQTSFGDSDVAVNPVRHLAKDVSLNKARKVKSVLNPNPRIWLLAVSNIGHSCWVNTAHS